MQQLRITDAAHLCKMSLQNDQHPSNSFAGQWFDLPLWYFWPPAARNLLQTGSVCALVLSYIPYVVHSAQHLSCSVPTDNVDGERSERLMIVMRMRMVTVMTITTNVTTYAANVVKPVVFCATGMQMLSRVDSPRPLCETGQLFGWR